MPFSLKRSVVPCLMPARSTNLTDSRLVPLTSPWARKFGRKKRSVPPKGRIWAPAKGYRFFQWRSWRAHHSGHCQHGGKKQEAETRRTKRKFYWNKTKKSLPGWKKNLRNSASWTKRALCARKIGKHHCVGKIFSVYRNRLLEEKRAFVEKYATEVFLQITNAPQKYKGIKIASDYSLLLELTNGETYQIEPGRTLNPSIGQSKVISLSYIAGLNRSSDFAAPVIIDNPLGLFSDEHRAAITRFLPHMGKQVILWSPPVIWLRSIKTSWSRMSKPSISWKTTVIRPGPRRWLQARRYIEMAEQELFS